MHDFELAFIVLLGFTMLLLGLFKLLRLCDRQIARAVRRLARHKNDLAHPGVPR